jgi:hypothetical protein
MMLGASLSMDAAALSRSASARVKLSRALRALATRLSIHPATTDPGTAALSALSASLTSNSARKRAAPASHSVSCIITDILKTKQTLSGNASPILVVSYRALALFVLSCVGMLP